MVPVVLPGTEELALGFLGPNILVDLRPDLERGVALQARAVRGEPASGPGAGPDPRAAICPYRGRRRWRNREPWP